MPDVGEFIKRTLEVAATRWRPVVGLTASLLAPAMALAMTALVLVIDDSDDGTSLFHLSDATSVRAGLVLVLLIVAALLVVWFATAVADQVYAAHQLADPRKDGPSFRDSLTVAASRALPVAASLMVPTALWVAGAVAVVMVGRNSPVLIVPAVGVLLVMTVWLGVKAVFIPVAGVGDRKGRGVIGASVAVSQGRFWPILGRLALTTAMVWAASSIGSAVVQPALLLGPLSLAIVLCLAVVSAAAQIAVAMSASAMLYLRTYVAERVQD